MLVIKNIFSRSRVHGDTEPGDGSVVIQDSKYGHDNSRVSIMPDYRIRCVTRLQVFAPKGSIIFNE